MYYPHNFKVSSTILDSDGMIMHVNLEATRHSGRYSLLRFVSQSYHTIYQHVPMFSFSGSGGLDLHTVSYYAIHHQLIK